MIIPYASSISIYIKKKETEITYQFYGETGEFKVEKDFLNIVKSRRSTRQFSDDIRSLLGIPDYYGILNAVSAWHEEKAIGGKSAPV